MGSEAPASGLKRELDDSGCVHDDSPVKKLAMENGYVGRAQLLDLSDDVLLYILKYLSPHDLKALGYTCSRLGSLVLERSLWCRVDARSVRCGRARARWLFLALHQGTTALLLKGRADRDQGCLGFVNRTRKEVEEERARRRAAGAGGDGQDNNINETIEEILGDTDEPRENNNQNGGGLEPPYPLFRQHARLHINAQHHLPRMSGSPSWPYDSDSDSETAPADSEPTQCPGPQFTVSRHMLKTLSDRCPKLRNLHLDYCNINCHKTTIMHFPPSLKKLSLRGTKCYNLPLDKSFLFKIHDYLPLLEYLDLSECSWLEPAALLPLSKMAALQTLLLRDCSAMAEFVAYVSLATRYGFRKLRELDFSGSPVGDSEVSALGWLPALERLSVAAPPPPAPACPRHHHYRDEVRPAARDVEPWELQEPDYYRHRHRSESQSPDTSVEDIEEQVQQLRQQFTQPDQITIEVYTRPQEAPPPPAQPERERREENTPKRTLGNSDNGDEEPGPSKRVKTEQGDKNSENSDDSSDFSDDNDDEPKAKRVKLDNKPKTSATGSKTNNNEPKGGENSDDNGKSSDDKKAGDGNNVMYRFCRNNQDNVESIRSRMLHSYRSSNEGSSNASRSNEGERQYSYNLNNKTVKISIRDRVSQSENNVENAQEDKINKNANKEVVKGENGKNAKDSENERLKVRNGESNSDGDSSQPSTSKQDSSQASTSKQNSQCVTSDEKDDHKDSQTSSNENSSEVSTAGGSNSSQDTTASQSGSQASVLIKCQSKASTSSSSSSSNEGLEPVQQYVRFRQNEDPVVIQCALPRQEQRDAGEPERAEPRHHVLYVNLGQQLHAVYRLLPNRPSFHSMLNRSTEHVNPSSLVSDSSIRHFGRAENANINVINIGPHLPQFEGRETGRPNRSSLRYLSVTGYRNVTNRSLMHLATAAPHLEHIDFRNTGVNESGVNYFKNLRPDCEVKFGEVLDENLNEE